MLESQILNRTTLKTTLRLMSENSEAVEFVWNCMLLQILYDVLEWILMVLGHGN